MNSKKLTTPVDGINETNNRLGKIYSQLCCANTNLINLAEGIIVNAEILASYDAGASDETTLRVVAASDSPDVTSLSAIETLLAPKDVLFANWALTSPATGDDILEITGEANKKIKIFAYSILSSVDDGAENVIRFQSEFNIVLWDVAIRPTDGVLNGVNLAVSPALGGFIFQGYEGENVYITTTEDHTRISIGYYIE